MFEFGIEDIKRNWIWIKFKDEFDEVIIDHSLLSGCDAPSILLKLLCELFIENKCEKYIAFHGESNIYVMKITLLCEFVTITIDNCRHSSFALACEGDILSTYLNYSSEQWIFKGISLYELGNTIYTEFKHYAYGDKYEWYEKSNYKFPSKQFKNLRHCLFL